MKRILSNDVHENSDDEILLPPNFKQSLNAIVISPSIMASSQIGFLIVDFSFILALSELGPSVQIANRLAFPLYTIALILTSSLIGPICIIKKEEIKANELLNHGHLIGLTATAISSIAFALMGNFYSAVENDEEIDKEIKFFMYSLIPALLAYVLSVCDSEYLLAKDYKKMFVFLGNIALIIAGCTLYPLAVGFSALPKCGLAAAGISMALGSTVRFLLTRLYFALNKNFAGEDLFNYKKFFHVKKHIMQEMLKTGFSNAFKLLVEPLGFFLSNFFLVSQDAVLPLIPAFAFQSLLGNTSIQVALGMALGTRNLPSDSYHKAKLLLIGSAGFSVFSLTFLTPLMIYSQEVCELLGGDSLEDQALMSTAIFNLRIALISFIFSGLKQCMEKGLAYHFQDLLNPAIQATFYYILLPIPLTLLLEYALNLFENEIFQLDLSTNFLIVSTVIEAIGAVVYLGRYLSKLNSENTLNKVETNSMTCFKRCSKNSFFQSQNSGQKLQSKNQGNQYEACNESRLIPENFNLAQLSNSS